MIERILSWWGHHLLAWLPNWLQVPQLPDATLAQVLPDGAIALARRRSGRVTPGGRVSAGLRAGGRSTPLGAAPGARVVLLLPPETFLRRDVELPLAAERDLGRVLGYEMDRLTPFATAEIDWSWSVLARDYDRARIRLALLFVPKAVSGPGLAALRDAGMRATALEAEGAAGGGTILLDTSGAWRWRGRALVAGQCFVAFWF